MCGVFVLGATALASHYAARHPQSFIGRVMHGASYAASKLTPASGFGPVLAALEKKPVEHDEVEGIPADPEPIEAAMPHHDAKMEVASGAPIVIPEDDEPAAPHVVGAVVEGSVLTPVQHELPFGPETEAPASVCRAPAVMPLCRDEDETCELLPEPAVETDEDEADVKTLLDVIEQKTPSDLEEITAEPKPVDECREDPHRHYQHSACPATGRSYPCPATGARPSCDPPKPHESQYQSPGGEESSESATPGESSSRTALKKIKRFKTREAVDEGCPTFPKHLSVDTLEMRPSDRQLYDYGPGAL
jgi:hypothetical protein